MSGIAHRRRSVRSDGVVGSDWNLSFSSLLVPLYSATRSSRGIHNAQQKVAGILWNVKNSNLLKTVEKVLMDGEKVENSHSQCSKVSSQKGLRVKNSAQKF
ncbi:hypothetical protein ALC56_04159 [Trachymyrmex septentrionalis]|uniref:Uncharacterized protein n=1 Tax=Trachymyrmex septentrionalis TaxID=34720 RepID=A0A151JZ12_9HYME|nr:hypothetical protein ALC56_04159 [Trachymyrmex septentrionalis]